MTDFVGRTLRLKWLKSLDVEIVVLMSVYRQRNNQAGPLKITLVEILSGRASDLIAWWGVSIRGFSGLRPRNCSMIGCHLVDQSETLHA